MQAEVICTITDSQATVEALQLIVADSIEQETARMRNCVARSDWHEAALCEGRMQAFSDFLGTLHTVAKEHKKKKGPRRDSL